LRKIPQQFVIVITVAATIVIWISTVAMGMMIPQAADAQQDEGNPPSLSSDVDNCASDQLPARIDGTMKCMRQGECYSYEVEGKKRKHCNFMSSK
jgi:hypothetical protein